MAKKRSLRLILRGLWRLASWPVRTLFRLTKDGVIFAALGLACATVTFFRTDELANIPLLICLVLASILFSGLLLGSWSLRHLGVHRRCTERTFAGEAVAVTLTLFNRARLPAGGVTLAESLRAAAKSKRPGAERLRTNPNASRHRASVRSGPAAEAPGRDRPSPSPSSAGDRSARATPWS